MIELYEMKKAFDNLTESALKLNEMYKKKCEIIDNAINFIDQVLMYHMLDYKQLDKDCDELIGILRGVDKE